MDVDYVSIDIDSCDLQVFSELVKVYRPKLISVEYNSHYECNESKVTICEREGPNGPERFQNLKNNIYGASLLALARVGEAAGYVLVWVVPGLDAWFVEEQLVCAGTAPAFADFCGSTGRAGTCGEGGSCRFHRDSTEEQRARWVRDYP